MDTFNYMGKARDKNKDIFQDASIVVMADSFMSLFGGAAVFSTIGFLSHKTGKAIPELIQSS